MSLYAETSGHFVDRTVGKITDRELPFVKDGILSLVPVADAAIPQNA